MDPNKPNPNQPPQYAPQYDPQQAIQGGYPAYPPQQPQPGYEIQDPSKFNPNQPPPQYAPQYAPQYNPQNPPPPQYGYNPQIQQVGYPMPPQGQPQIQYPKLDQQAMAYPPQPMHQEQIPEVGSTVVIQNQKASEQAKRKVYLDRYPIDTTCPSCKTEMKTKTSKGIAPVAWIICVVFFVCGLWICSLFPICCMQKTSHYCSSCGNFMGTYGGGV